MNELRVIVSQLIRERSTGPRYLTTTVSAPAPGTTNTNITLATSVAAMGRTASLAREPPIF
jgi:hypothetical protein